MGVDMRGRLNASRDTIIPTRRVKFTLTPIYMTSNTRLVHEERAKDDDRRSPLLAQHHIAGFDPKRSRESIAVA